MRHSTTSFGINDAALSVDEFITINSAGISVTVDSILADGNGYNIAINYTSPTEDYNVHINKGDPTWISPDIWVDNQRDGGGYQSYDALAHLSLGPVDEPPIANEENRIFARVYNSGPAKAYDVEVKFTMSEPYHTVGGVGGF